MDWKGLNEVEGWMNAIGTWELMSLSHDKKAIGCKWVFAVKVNPYGFIAHLKAHLVAKSYAQIDNVDYSDTFSPTAKLTYFLGGYVWLVFAVAWHQKCFSPWRSSGRGLYGVTTWFCYLGEVG